MSGPVNPAALLDRQGCLTAAGLAAFQNAPPGRAPKDLAAHVAACARCQQRLLSGMRGPAPNVPARRPSPGRRLVWLAVLAIGGLFLLVAGLVAVRSLAR